MVHESSTTVEEYLQDLPASRRKIITELRNFILKKIPKGYQETLRWGMISYEVPLDRYSSTYNKQPLSYIGLASQKNHIGLYLMNIYQDKNVEGFLRNAFAEKGKKLNMGKACIRFKKIDDIPLNAIGRIIASTSVNEFIDQYEASRNN
ncbi:DUF1801 domain-containing protein [Candidatus Gottesmanbacteria bacterium]|nr:DUF1801 domain-containing protein [Candidatus Gottesmanbacteria bacterium]